MSTQQAHGLLVITDRGQRRQSVLIAEGGGWVGEVEGHTLAFRLEKAPGIEEMYDVRKMPLAEIAKHLARRIEEEESDREQDALERSFHD